MSIGVHFVVLSTTIDIDSLCHHQIYLVHPFEKKKETNKWDRHQSYLVVPFEENFDKKKLKSHNYGKYLLSFVHD